MLNLFRRTKIEQWEIDVIINTFEKLGSKYSIYQNQVANGLLKSVRLGEDDSINLVAFTFNRGLSNEYINEKEGYQILRGIQVFDLLSKKSIEMEVHMANGLVFGYATPFNKKVKLDPMKIDVTRTHVSHSINPDFEEIRTYLTDEEIAAVNTVDFEKIIIANVVVYRIKNLDNGDFIAIDSKKHVYKVTHDPYELTKLADNLGIFLKNHK